MSLADELSRIFPAGTRVTIRAPYRGPIGSQAARFEADGFEGEWIVVAVGDDLDLGLAKHAGDEPHVWIAARRVSHVDGEPL